MKFYITFGLAFVGLFGLAMTAHSQSPLSYNEFVWLNTQAQTAARPLDVAQSPFAAWQSNYE